MKNRNNTPTVFLVLFLLLGSMSATPNDDKNKIISFAIPISDNFMSVLRDQTGTDNREVSEILQRAGIMFYPGSEVSLDDKETKIVGKLARSEALLVVELSQMLSTSTVEEVRLYFFPPSECFPPKGGEQQNAAGQPATRSMSK